MPSSWKLHLTTVIIAAAAVQALCATTTGLIPDINVKIINYLEGSMNLQVHCKDKNTDLGVHQIPSGGDYFFKAEPTFFDRADYYCGFVFDNALHRFDIYTDKRDYVRCKYMDSCDWYITKDGPCYMEPFNRQDCYPWK